MLMQQKIRNSKNLYPTKQNEIDYVCMRTEDLAWDVISDRADAYSTNPYNSLEELWQDLDHAF
jgi:hypothetical protein